MKFIDLPASAQQQFIRVLSHNSGLDPQIIEKDWWVTAVLRAVFSLPYSESLSFKGGTSLSKCWKLIERFSEDVDIAVSREYLGFSGDLSKTQISDKLRRAACSFVRERLQLDIRNKMLEQGTPADCFTVAVNITPITTTDPERIEIQYQSKFSNNPYIKNQVIVEVSGRSMSEPLKPVSLRSILEDNFPEAPFVEAPVTVNAVIPERTFLEKICLLHEEFSHSPEQIRVDRMSRHLYDIIKIADTDIAGRALLDRSLWNNIIEHRHKFIGLKGFDYTSLSPDKISIVPPDAVIEQWRKDYDAMREIMIYGDSPEFNDLIDQIRSLNIRINNCPQV